MSDPNLQRTTLQLQCEDIDNSGLIKDSSYGYNSIVKTGNIYFDTIIKRVGNSSLKINVGTNNGIANRLAIPTAGNNIKQNFSFPGDFTIRLRFNPSVVGVLSGHYIIDTRRNDVVVGTGWSIGFGYSGGGFANRLFFDTTGANFLFSNIAPSIGTWWDVDIVRIDNTISMFVSGIKQTATITATGLINATNFNMFTSSNFDANTWFSGYIDAVRIINGVGLFTNDYVVDFDPFEEAPPPKCSSLIGIEQLRLVSSNNIDNLNTRFNTNLLHIAKKEVPAALGSSITRVAKGFNTKNLDISGPGVIEGTVYKQDTPNRPYRVKLLLMNEVTGTIVRSTFSDSVTGRYMFEYLSMNYTYSILAYDLVNKRSAIIASGRVPVKLT